MDKSAKRFRPKYIKRSLDRPSGIGQTGAGTLSARPGPGRYVLGYPPKPYMQGQSGEPSSSPSVTASRLMQNSYTEEDMEDFKDRDDVVGKAGNYQSSFTRQYRDSGPGRTMQGAAGLGEGLIREFIRAVIQEGKTPGKNAYVYELMKEEDEDDDEIDEASGAAAVAGYSLPLGMSNRGPDQPPSWASYMHAINGSPVQVVGKDTLKVKPMKKPSKRSRKS